MLYWITHIFREVICIHAQTKRNHK